MKRRQILHADMDAFYASVEQRDDPNLRGRPVAVGGPAPRGVISAASYEAREFGVKSAMPTSKALRICPDLVLVGGRMGDYAEISNSVFEIFRDFSPLVEPLSLDEAFVDLTGSERLFGSAERVGREIKARVKKRLDLVVSVGIGPNKFIAKIASDLEKPDGFVQVDRGAVQTFLNPLPVSVIFGVGPVTRKKLSGLGIETIGQLADCSKEMLTRNFKNQGEHLWALARGIDDRPVIPQWEPKSIGHENTFDEDINDLDELRFRVQEQADRVAARLRKKGYGATVVTVKVKTGRFESHTCQRALSQPTVDGFEIGLVAKALLDEIKPKLGPLRLTGVSAGGLTDLAAPRQLDFNEDQRKKKAKLGAALDNIHDAFGRGALRRGDALKKDHGS